jgi:hypothetical protein
MPFRQLVVWVLALSASPICVAATSVQPEKAADRGKSLAEQIAALKQQHQDREKQFYDELRSAARDNEKISKANEEYQEFAEKHAGKLKALIREHGKDPAVFDGFLVLIGELRYFLDDDLVKLVLTHHMAHPKMGHLCFELRYRSSDSWAENILKEAASKHPDQAVRGQATYALGDYYSISTRYPEKKLSEEELAKRLAVAERHYAEVAKNHASIRTPGGQAKLGDKAASELTRLKNLPNLKVGKPAPEIVGEDLDGNELKLSDHRGKVVVLDFWGHW